jgi:N-hydroxyarylamine O-acetyltransferase
MYGVRPNRRGGRPVSAEKRSLILFPHPVFLDSYCARIGYNGEHTPTLDTLRALHGAHVQAIPFENLDPLLHITPKLDAMSLEAKLVQKRRGGYCFEHNLLFRHVLETIGFRVTSLAARVLWNGTAEVVTPKSHMLLRVDLADGPYIADVGFGNLTLTAPLRLVSGVVQSTPHESFRLIAAEAGLYRTDVEIGPHWKPLYRFDLHEQYLIDYEVTNWYLSTNPRSRFMTDLIAARADRDCRYALRNADFAVHYPGGSTERRTLTTVSELKDVLTGPLGLSLPDHADLEVALGRIVANAAAATPVDSTPQSRGASRRAIHT